MYFQGEVFSSLFPSTWENFESDTVEYHLVHNKQRSDHITMPNYQHTSLHEESIVFKLFPRSATCEPNWILKENTRSFDSIRGTFINSRKNCNKNAIV
jgi:hypothetical protein